MATKAKKLGATRGRFWALSWPAMLSGVSVPLLGLVDTSIVGRLSQPEALGAVALGSWLFDMLYWSFGFLRMGTTGLVAQARGAEDQASLRPLLARPLIIGIIAGLGVIGLGLLGAERALSILSGGESAALADTAKTYVQARLLGGPAVLMNYACLGWLLGMGRVKLALLTQLSLNSINAALSVWWGARWGVEGVAYASATAQWLTLLGWGSWIWLRLCPPLPSSTLRAALKDASAWGELATLNLRLWVRTCLLLSCFGGLNAMSARLGALTLSANALLLHLQSLQAFILDGFAHGAEVLVGERLGRGDRVGYRDALRVGAEWTFGASLLIAGGYALGAPMILRALTHHMDVITQAERYMIWAVISPVISAPCFLLDGVMIGATESATMQRGMMISALVFAVGLITFTPLLGNHGLWLALMFFMSSRAITLTPRAISLGSAQI